MLDSSVLVAAFYTGHPHFTASHQLLKKLPEKQRIACIHSVAETFSSITRLPIQPRPTPHNASLFLESLSKRLYWLPATPDAYTAALEQVSAMQLSGGKIYDALILQTAIEHGAKKLYTWNSKDFELLAKGLPIKILKPDQVD